MNAYNTEEQQVEELKNWFKENGTSLLFVAAVLLLGLSGWRYYQNSEETKAQQAATAYYQMMSVMQTDTELADAQARALIDQFPKTPYRDLATLSLAKLAVEEERFDEAKLHLQWLIEHSKQQAIPELARLRLTYVLMAEEDWQAALAWLNEPPGDEGFAALYLETKGDIHLQLQQPEQAISVYQQALNKDINPSASQRIERKLEYLGIASEVVQDDNIPQIDISPTP